MRTGEDLSDLAVARGFLYVASREGRLRTYDLAQPARPRLRHTHESPDGLFDLEIEGTRGYVLSGPDVWLFDLSLPHSPSPLGRRRLRATDADQQFALNGVQILHVRDGIAYLKDDRRSSLWTADLTGDELTVPAVHIDLPGEPFEVEDDGMRHWGSTFIDSVDGYVLTSSARITQRGLEPSEEHILHVLDARDPDAPILVASVDLDTLVHDVALHAGHLVMRGVDGLTLVDVSAPTRPGPVVQVAGFDGLDFAMDGPLAYMRSGSLEVVDLSFLAQPRLLGRVPTLGSVETFGSIAVDGRRAVVGLAGKLQLFDLSVPGCPQWLAGLDVGGYRWHRALEADAGRAYVLYAEALLTFDIRGRTPRQVGERALPPADGASCRGAEHLALAGSLAYVGDCEGVRVVDVADPARPVQIVHVPQPKGVRRLAADGRLLAVVDRDDTLRVWQLDDPRQPRLHYQLPVDIPKARDVALGIVGQHVIVATALELWTFDTTVGPNAFRPATQEWHANPAYGSFPRSDVHLALDGALAYVSSASTGLVLVDVADPGAPRLHALHDEDFAPRQTSEIDLGDTSVFLGITDGSLWILPIARPASVATPRPTPPGDRPHRVFLPTLERFWIHSCP